MLTLSAKIRFKYWKIRLLVVISWLFFEWFCPCPEYNKPSFLLQLLLYNWKLVFWQIWLQFSLTFQPCISSPKSFKNEKNVVTGMNCRLVIQSWMETWPCLIRDPFWYRKIHRMRTAALKSNNGEKYQEAKVIIPVDKRGWGWLLAGGKNSKKRSCRWIITNDDQSHFSNPKCFWGHWNFPRKKVVFWILSMQKMRLYCHFGIFNQCTLFENHQKCRI